MVSVQKQGITPWTLSLFAVSVFMVRAVMLMLGPLLVALADDFGTTLAVAGQLAAATFITWGITAPLVGPISDAYGRRPVLLIGIALIATGSLASGLAWDYGSLMVFRLITGIGCAMVPPTVMAALADSLPPEKVGRAVGFITASSWVGVALGVPGIALLSYVGDWRLTFYVVGLITLALWGLLWRWLPRADRPVYKSVDPIERFKSIGRRAGPWFVLIANASQQAVLLGLTTYFAAYMIESHGWDEASTAPGLALLGVGAVIGSSAGGFIAGRARRLDYLAVISLTGGILAAAVFATGADPWIVVTTAFVASMLVSVSMPILMTIMMGLAGDSRGTAGGMFSTSNQTGGFIGASAGGLMLSLGGFSALGLLYLCSAALSAAIVGLLMRSSAPFWLKGTGR